jgi:hypothetical protein
MTCWNVPGNFRETAGLGCGLGSAGADYRPDLLTLLTPPELCKAAVVCRCLGAPARSTSGQSSIQELSWKLPGSLPEGPGGGSRGTETGQEEGQGECTGDRGACCGLGIPCQVVDGGLDCVFPIWPRV